MTFLVSSPLSCTHCMSGGIHPRGRRIIFLNRVDHDTHLRRSSCHRRTQTPSQSLTPKTLIPTSNQPLTPNRAQPQEDPRVAPLQDELKERMEDLRRFEQVTRSSKLEWCTCASIYRWRCSR